MMAYREEKNVNVFASDLAHQKRMQQGSERLLAALIANDMIGHPAGATA